MLALWIDLALQPTIYGLVIRLAIIIGPAAKTVSYVLLSRATIAA